MKKFSLLFAVLLVFCAFFFVSCGSKQPELNVYSIISDEETKVLTDLFTEKTGIKVNYIRATTGELVNRVIAEKAAPVADVLLGGGSSYHIQADSKGALEQYVSPLSTEIPKYAKAENGTWTGICVVTLGIGVNKTRFEQKFPNEKLPQTWDDLLNPAFAGEIVITNPVASSTAYLFLQNQLQRLGDTKGFEYLFKLAKSVGQFPDSGSAPPKLVGTGEYTIGVAYLHALAKYRSQGFDIELIAPPQSAGDVDAISILKNAKNLDSAKQFVDFMLSKEAQELMSSMDFTIPVNKNAIGVEGSIPIEDIDLIVYDSKKASDERSTVLEKWSKEVK